MKTSQGKYESKAMTVKLFLRILERSKLMYRRLFQIDKRFLSILRALLADLLCKIAGSVRLLSMLSHSSITDILRQRRAHLKEICGFGV